LGGAIIRQNEAETNSHYNQKETVIKEQVSRRGLRNPFWKKKTLGVCLGKRGSTSGKLVAENPIIERTGKGILTHNIKIRTGRVRSLEGGIASTTKKG